MPYQRIALPEPWATAGCVLALPGPPTADAVAEVAARLSARSPQWTLMVRAEDEHRAAGFERWDLMPVLVLRDGRRRAPRYPPTSHPARDRLVPVPVAEP